MPKFSEVELEKRLADAEDNLKDSKKRVDTFKKQWIDAETNYIQQKINVERLTEQIRRFRLANPAHEVYGRDIEIDRFRVQHPEVCEMAAQRDKDKK